LKSFDNLTVQRGRKLRPGFGLPGHCPDAGAEKSFGATKPGNTGRRLAVETMFTKSDLVRDRRGSRRPPCPHGCHARGMADQPDRKAERQCVQRRCKLCVLRCPLIPFRYEPSRIHRRDAWRCFRSSDLGSGRRGGLLSPPPSDPAGPHRISRVRRCHRRCDGGPCRCAERIGGASLHLRHSSSAARGRVRYRYVDRPWLGPGALPTSRRCGRRTSEVNGARPTVPQARKQRPRRQFSRASPICATRCWSRSRCNGRPALGQRGWLHPEPTSGPMDRRDALGWVQSTDRQARRRSQTNSDLPNRGPERQCRGPRQGRNRPTMRAPLDRPARPDAGHNC